MQYPRFLTKSCLKCDFLGFSPSTLDISIGIAYNTYLLRIYLQLMSHEQNKKKSWLQTLGLSLGALGVVYGDIGTSPLYAVREIFFGHAHLELSPENIFGITSIVFWALTLIVAFKYVVFVLRADNHGEGGVFALYDLIQKHKSTFNAGVGLLLLLAAGLLFGDGVITPAISVISAIEGLTVITPSFQPYVVPITIGILVALFAIQRKGTHTIGKVFGPVIALWFIAIGAIGINYILKYPQILGAINPLHAVWFFAHNPLHTIVLVLGSVMLVVTGGEAMYADMGHFGRTPIRFSWFMAAYPALFLNYFGQGGYLLSIAGHAVEGTESIFFAMVPSWGLGFMVCLATAATVIASQALITGAFSLTSQAISLGLLPYLKTIHTNHDHEGQIYVPAVNWLLLAGCVTLVLMFKSSGNLASAYGLAVAGVMLVTTLGMFSIAKYYWKWPMIAIISLFGPLAVVDALFLLANSLKLVEGGYLPLSVGIALLFIMRTWQWGQQKLRNIFEQSQSMTMAELVALRKKTAHILPRSALHLTASSVEKLSDKVPLSQQMYLDRKFAFPKNLVFLHIKNERVPFVTEKQRFSVTPFYAKKKEGCILSITARVGFMENFNVDSVVEQISNLPDVIINDDSKNWIIHELQVIILANKKTTNMSLWGKLQRWAFKMLYESTGRIDEYYDLDEHHVVSFEVLPTRLGQ